MVRASASGNGEFRRSRFLRTRFSQKLVRKAGFEPAHPFGHWNLNPACLPFHHFRALAGTSVRMIPGRIGRAVRWWAPYTETAIPPTRAIR